MKILRAHVFSAVVSLLVAVLRGQDNCENSAGCADVGTNFCCCTIVGVSTCKEEVNCGSFVGECMDSEVGDACGGNVKCYGNFVCCFDDVDTGPAGKCAADGDCTILESTAGDPCGGEDKCYGDFVCCFDSNGDEPAAAGKCAAPGDCNMPECTPEECGGQEASDTCCCQYGFGAESKTIAACMTVDVTSGGGTCLGTENKVEEERKCGPPKTCGDDHPDGACSEQGFCCCESGSIGNKTHECQPVAPVRGPGVCKGGSAAAIDKLCGHVPPDTCSDKVKNGTCHDHFDCCCDTNTTDGIYCDTKNNMGDGSCLNHEGVPTESSCGCPTCTQEDQTNVTRCCCRDQFGNILTTADGDDTADGCQAISENGQGSCDGMRETICGDPGCKNDATCGTEDSKTCCCMDGYGRHLGCDEITEHGQHSCSENKSLRCGLAKPQPSDDGGASSNQPMLLGVIAASVAAILAQHFLM